MKLTGKFLLFLFIFLGILTYGYPQTLDKLLLKAETFSRLHNYSKAALYYQKYLAKDNNKWIRLKLARIYFKVYNYSRALFITEELIRREKLKKKSSEKFSRKCFSLRKKILDKIEVKSKEFLSRLKTGKVVNFSPLDIYFDIKINPGVLNGKKGELVSITLHPKRKRVLELWADLSKLFYFQKKNKYLCLNFYKEKKVFKLKFFLANSLPEKRSFIVTIFGKTEKNSYFKGVLRLYRELETENYSYLNKLKLNYTVKLLYKDKNSILVTSGKIKIGSDEYYLGEKVLTKKNLEENKKEFEIGTDYFVWAVIKNGIDYVISKSETGPQGIKLKKLIGYFHYAPDKRILRNSIVTNDNLNGKTLPAGIPLPGMVRVGNFAIDIYENSLENGKPVSKYGKVPIGWIDQAQARGLAWSIGKRLPTSAEWYRAAQGTPDSYLHNPGNGSEESNIFPDSIPYGSIDTNGIVNIPYGKANLSSKTLTGTCIKSVSKYGCFDMIGNMWEWTADCTTGNEYPYKGYVVEVDRNGFPKLTSDKIEGSLNGDYYMVAPHQKWYGVMRGGCWYDAEKAGIYAVDINCYQTFSCDATGFRCAR